MTWDTGSTFHPGRVSHPRDVEVLLGKNPDNKYLGYNTRKPFRPEYLPLDTHGDEAPTPEQVDMYPRDVVLFQ